MDNYNITPLLPNEIGANQVRNLDKVDDKKLLTACQEFEAIFLGIMYKTMKKTVPDNPFMPKSNGERIFEDMLLDEVAKINTKSKGLGIAEMIYNQFKQNRTGIKVD